MSTGVRKYLTDELTIRAASVVCTEAIEEMRKIQNTSPLATIAIGRAMIGSILMASHLKERQTVSLYFQGNGPMRGVYAEANFEGDTRGYALNPQVEPFGEELSVGKALGIGLLSVTHHLPGQTAPYRGTVELPTGEIGDDIAYYLHQSHQIQSIVSLGVQLDTYGRVVSAGGVMVELMPGVSDETIEKLRVQSKNISSVSKAIADGADADALVRMVLNGFNLNELPHDFKVKYNCHCSQDRVVRTMSLLGLAEIDSILQEGKFPLEVKCEFCGRAYNLSENEIYEIRAKLHKESLH